MTMQVGMVGTDGILIASDTKWYGTPTLPPDKLWHGGRASFHSPKIKISYTRGMAISQAMNMETAEHVAEELIRTLSDDDFVNPINHIRTIGKRVLDQANAFRQEAHCLIMLTRPVPQLLIFAFAVEEGMRTPVCRKMDSIAFAGDNVNPAIFLAERYYKKAPIKSLIPLAAHLILAASALNNGAIGGLEIVFCDESGLHRISNESVQALESWSMATDRKIESLFLGGAQEFSYAPDVVG